MTTSHSQTRCQSWPKKRGDEHLEASECFVGGHCFDSRVNESLTAEDIPELCNGQYKKQWKQEFTLYRPSFPVEYSKRVEDKTGWPVVDGLNPVNTPDFFGVLGCAFEYTHCQKMYCKLKYCNKPEYQKVYLDMKMLKTVRRKYHDILSPETRAPSLGRTLFKTPQGEGGHEVRDPSARRNEDGMQEGF